MDLELELEMLRDAIGQVGLASRKIETRYQVDRKTINRGFTMYMTMMHIERQRFGSFQPSFTQSIPVLITRIGLMSARSFSHKSVSR